MNDNTNALTGIKHNMYYFYSICGVIGIGIFNNILTAQYADEAKLIAKEITDKYKGANSLESINTILAETTERTVIVASKYTTILAITQFLSLISFALLVTAIFFLAKTVTNYYGEYSRSKEGKTLVTPSGAAWGWFIPFLNLVRPFNTTNEVLNGETTPQKDGQVSTAQYSLWAGVALSIINGLMSSVTPTILSIALGIVSSLLALYATYLMFQVHNRIFAKQSGN
jgi:hypothetical protein